MKERDYLDIYLCLPDFMSVLQFDQFLLFTFPVLSLTT